MEIPKRYNPAAVEEKWYQRWQEYNLFRSIPDEREPYCIVMPPPNVTGVLHMGHMLNNTIQDVLIRKARMQGKNACWVPGTDHASIATEAKVVAFLREKNIRKSDLSREEFLQYAWEWKEKYGGIILEQLKKLGASADWERVHFTMDEGYYKAVIRVFVDLYRKGFIYRGLRMINWDCEAQTAISNEEVIYAEEGEKGVLYHVRYRLQDSDAYLVIATQRPETIMGDTAVAVNPEDERYRTLVGKTVLVPLVNRPVPIIADAYVDKTFGTGCLKVTPAHDPNDYEIGLRHNLPVINTINPDGTLNANCGLPEYVGKDRFEVRKLVVDRLRSEGLMVKEEEFITRIGRSERTHSIVEPMLSMQWFIKMKELSQRALDAVEKNEVKLIPEKFKNTYRHWMENVRDWCISRQLWWGHRIPAWYDEEDNIYVAETFEEALQQYKEKYPRASASTSALRQDEDVLDTWASSWLWPIAVFDGFNDPCFDKHTGKIRKEANPELNYYYPTKILVTAPEILFFWVARMIIAGYTYLDEKPFEEVYLTGIVRDKQRRKMSKSLGNSPEPLELIKRYGADGVRIGMLFSSPAGNDLLFDEKLCEQGRNFCNKIWNALRLVKGWKLSDNGGSSQAAALLWFENRLHQVTAQIEYAFSGYRISEALQIVYSFIWDDFCSWYLEMIKPPYGQPLDRNTYEKTIQFFEKILQLAHPFLPFITEEIWHLLRERDQKEFIMTSAYPVVGFHDEQILQQAEVAKEIITCVRDARNQLHIAQNEPLNLSYLKGCAPEFGDFKDIILKLANLKSLSGMDKEPEGVKTFLVGTCKFFIETPVAVNAEEERKRLMQEMDYIRGFIRSVESKLNNARFTQNAPPEVVEKERKKLQDGQAKLKALEESLARLHYTG
ncbi:MAG: valine--tRNA ligase [Chitinophagales bacterium]|nr:MAG: valine--tRNA ligase [Chitinophagales bacterium]